MIFHVGHQHGFYTSRTASRSGTAHLVNHFRRAYWKAYGFRSRSCPSQVREGSLSGSPRMEQRWSNSWLGSTRSMTCCSESRGIEYMEDEP
ncbi:MAG: hypothetical protein ACYTFG_00030 [Planctomycetota bacterium]|jgi:hypothetical protein